MDDPKFVERILRAKLVQTIMSSRPTTPMFRHANAVRDYQDAVYNSSMKDKGAQMTEATMNALIEEPSEPAKNLADVFIKKQEQTSKSLHSLHKKLEDLDSWIKKVDNICFPK